MPLFAFRPRPSLRPALLSALAVLAILPPTLAHAETGARYVRLRAQYGCARNVSYTQVKENAGGFAGSVIELRGTVGGVVSGGNTLTVMLNLLDGSGEAPTLDIPKSQASVVQSYSTPRVRVLARVSPSSTGNVPLLAVLAVAHDSEVNTEDAKGEAQTYASAQSRIAQSAARRGTMSRSSSLLASRGNFQRQTTFVPNGPAGPEGLPDNIKHLFAPYAAYIAKVNPRLTAYQVGQITYHLLNFAYQKGVEPRLVVAMIIAESGFDPYSTSHSGAMGLGQLMPGTARDLGLNNAYDPMQNLDGCISYLKSRLATFGNLGSTADPTDQQIALALAAYNAGMGAVRKYNGVPPYRETQAYVRRILRIYHELKGS